MIEHNINSNGPTLSIVCADSIDVKARFTFDYEIFEGYQVTYWQDDDEDVEERINSIFGILFDEVLKNRKNTEKSRMKSTFKSSIIKQ